MLADSNEPPHGSLLREGNAMLAAIAEDFSRIPNTTVVTTRDSRIKNNLQTLPTDSGKVHFVSSPDAHDEAIASHAKQADATFVIAPEFAGELLRITNLVTAAGGNLIGPDRSTIQWTSDKNLTIERLAANNIPVPTTFRTLQERTYPLVVKRIEGAGSDSVFLCESPRDLDRVLAMVKNQPFDVRIESHCPGTPVSVALLLGRKECVALPTCEQHLSGDFAYLGGRVLTGTGDSKNSRSSVANRARNLALRVTPLLNGTGYVGVDMVIPEDDTSGEGTVIEINPRLTTSYVGLRAAATANLAEVMLRIADGMEILPNELGFLEEDIPFFADGSLNEAPYP